MSVKIIRGTQTFDSGVQQQVLKDSNSPVLIGIIPGRKALYLAGGDGSTIDGFEKSFLVLEDTITNVGFDFSNMANEAFRTKLTVTDVAGVSGQDMINLFNNVGVFQMSFFGAATVPKATVAIAEIAFVENAGGAVVNVDSTFGGYTVQQLVNAIKLYGLLT